MSEIRRRGGALRLAGLTTTAATVALFFLASPAQAKIAYRGIGSFGGSGTAENGAFANPLRTAADPVTGTLFVADRSLNQVDVYKPIAAETGLEGAGVEFLFAIHTPNPFGVAVDPANGALYVMNPAAPAANELQGISVVGVPDGGQYELTFEGQTTTALPKGASNAAIKAALEALSKIGIGNVKVFGEKTVEIKGALAATDVPQMTASGGATVKTVQNGRLAAPGAIAKFEPDNRASPAVYSKDLAFTSPAEGTAAGQVECFGKANEIAVDPTPYFGGIAVDPTGAHDILVADPCKNQVERFSSAGASIEGWNGSNGSPGSGPFISLQDLTIKPDGDVVVANVVGEGEEAETRVLRYSGSGEYKAPLGPVPNVLPTFTGVVLATDPATGEIFASSATLNLEGNPSGHVYRFGNADQLIEKIGVEGSGFDGIFYGLAIQPPLGPGEASRLYALASEQPFSGTPRIQVFESGEQAEATMEPVEEFLPEEEAGVAGPTGYEAVFEATVTPNVGSSVVDCHFEYLTEAAYLENLAAEPPREGFAGANEEAKCEPMPSSAGSVAVRGVGHDLRPKTAYRARILIRKKGFSPVTAVPAPPHEAFTTPAPAPTLAAERAWSVSDTTATLAATVNPNRTEVTECRFEYGTSTAYGHEAPCAPAEPGSGGKAVQVIADIGGLSHDTTYHFRLDAASGAGSRQGEDATFATRPPVVFPERHYELVSAFENNGVAALPELSSLDGNHFAYTSPESPLPGSEAGNYSKFVSSRHVNPDGTVSWIPTYVGPPHATTSEGDLLSTQPIYSANDLSHVAWGTDLSIDPNDRNYASGSTGLDVYLRKANDGSITWLSCAPPEPLASPTCPPSGSPQTDPAAAGEVEYVSPDGSRVLFASSRRLLPADVATGSNRSLYESHEGRLSLISIGAGETEGLPNGSTLGSTNDKNGTGNPFAYGNPVTRNAVSSDGRRVAFESPQDSSSGFSIRETDHLYVRVNGEATVDASASTLDPTPLGVNYWGADENMESVFFTSASPLTADSSAPDTPISFDTGAGGSADLYRYVVPADGDPAHGQLADLTPKAIVPGESGGAGVDQVLWVSDDGHRVYFLSSRQLDGKGVPNGPDLYLWTDDGSPNGKLTFIATGSVVLAVNEETGNQGTAERNRQVSASPDGSILTFRSHEDLVPGRRSGGQLQVYVYDALREELSCASCPPDGSDPSAPASLTPLEGGLDIGHSGGINQDVPHVRNVSSDGAVFFQTQSSLLPADSNGKQSVYEWRGGKLRLISAGDGPSNSIFGGASSDGSTVFFASADHYVRGIAAGSQRIYAARVGPPPPEAEERPPCSGEDCKPVATPQPEAATPGSSTLFGPGNLRQHRHHNRRKHQKRHRRAHHRAASRHHGGAK